MSSRRAWSVVFPRTFGTTHRACLGLGPGGGDGSAGNADGGVGTSAGS